MERLSEKLGLDAAQRATVQQTFEKYHAQMAPLREQAHKTREALSEELASAQPNQARVASLTDQLQKDRRAIFAVMEQRQAELKKELTPTQYAKLMLRHGRGFHGKQK